jgi:hypothetical protein
MTTGGIREKGRRGRKGEKGGERGRKGEKGGERGRYCSVEKGYLNSKR